MTAPKLEAKPKVVVETKVAVPDVPIANSVQEEKAMDVAANTEAVESKVKGRKVKRGEKREKVDIAKEEMKKGTLEEEPVLAALNPDIMEEEAENGGDAAERAVMNDISAPPISSDLSYGVDKAGSFAIYKLKPGEALYSSVVVRFTDYSENAEIHAALDVVQKRSGISDPRKMTAGQAVKIPLDMLADRYHPQGSQERAQFEEIQTAVERVGTRRSVARDLEGVVLILDPGHGGRVFTRTKLFMTSPVASRKSSSGIPTLEYI
jgi:N-acetylmuramoyl-L-alanine amidase